MMLTRQQIESPADGQSIYINTTGAVGGQEAPEGTFWEEGGWGVLGSAGGRAGHKLKNSTSSTE